MVISEEKKEARIDEITGCIMEVHGMGDLEALYSRLEVGEKLYERLSFKKNKRFQELSKGERLYELATKFRKFQIEPNTSFLFELASLYLEVELQKYKNGPKEKILTEKLDHCYQKLMVESAYPDWMQEYNTLFSWSDYVKRHETIDKRLKGINKVG